MFRSIFRPSETIDLLTLQHLFAHTFVKSHIFTIFTHYRTYTKMIIVHYVFIPFAIG